MLYNYHMRRFIQIIAVATLAIPLTAAVPASRIREPNAVFTYAIDGGRVTATLFDRLRKKTVDVLDAKTDLPLAAGVSLGGNDAMQLSPATGKIYAIVQNVSGYDGSTIDTKLPYDVAIMETNFDFREPTVVFSCDDCSTEQWLVHPTKPKLYISVPDAYKNGDDEFRAAKLVEVTLSPRLRTRVLTRIPAHAALRITPDGKILFVFGTALHSRDPYGEMVTVNLSTRQRVQKTVNFPRTGSLGDAVSPMSADASPDALEMAYHLGVIDVKSGNDSKLMKGNPHAIDSMFIGWSRDAKRILFQLQDDDTADNNDVQLIYDRATKREWVLPLQDAHLLDWSPAQTAILYEKHGDVGYYDLEARTWVFVAEASEGSWIILPTKRVPKD